MHSRQSDITSVKMFPNVHINLKHLTCANCRHVFSFRGAHQFRGKIPFLLECGHAICEMCVKTRSTKTCGSCGAVYPHNSINEQNNFSVNLYLLGLINAGHSNFANTIEPNTEFQLPAAARFRKSNADNLEQCSECGLRADFRCIQCEVFFCNTCYAKIHGRALQNHQKISAAGNAGDIYNYLMGKCKEHPNETVQLYCHKCDVPACTQCAMISHQGHSLTSQSAKSADTKAQIENAIEKLNDTLQRIKMTEKKVAKPLKLLDTSQDDDTEREQIEATITKHFTYLHGILQNIETRFINQLQLRQNFIGNNINAIKEQLKVQKEDIGNAILLAHSALDSDCALDTVAVIDKLEQALNVPCHLVHNSFTDDKIELNIDESIVDSLNEHCSLYLPEISSYGLARTEDLPDDYEIEEIVREPIPKPTALLAIKPAPLNLSRTSLSASTYSLRSITDKKQNSNLIEGGSSEAVTITHIKDPSCFYTQSLCRSGELTKLHKSLTAQALTSPIPTQLELNKIYLVQYGTDMKWYRGRVKTLYKDNKDNQVCDVFYVDFGNTEHKIPIRKIRNMAIQSSFIPVMAKQCTLHDIVPRNGQWDIEANKAMLAMIRGKASTIMHIFKVQNNVYHVDITKNTYADGDYTLSVRDALIFLEYGCFISNERLRKTQSMRKFYEEEISVESIYDVRVTHNETPDCIYVQKFVEGITHVTKLTADMMEEYGNDPINRGIIYTPQIGMPCAVRYTDGKWYRGRISNLLGNRKVEVFFIDFGDTREYEYSAIRRLHHKFMHVNALAFRISLKDVAPLKNNEWSSEAKKYMDSKLLSKYLKIFVFSKESDSYRVVLYIPKDHTDLNFNAMLAKEQLALSTGPSSQCVNTPRANLKKRKRKVSKTNKSAKFLHGTKDDEFDNENEIVDESDPFRMQVHVLQTVSPDCIYVRDVKCVKEMKKMTEDIQNFYNKYRSAESEDWEKDNICIAYSAKDKSYHRAKILQIIPPEQVDVLLYDIGITETVTLQDLQSLHPKFAKLPPKAFKIKLAGILPCGGTSTWLSSSCEVLTDLINKNYPSNFYITKVAGTEGDATCAELWVKENTMTEALAPTIVEINSINRKLVKAGVALPVRGYKNETDKVLAVELRQQLLQSDAKSPLTAVEWIVKAEGSNYPSEVATEQSIIGSSVEISDLEDISDDENVNDFADGESDEGSAIPPPLSAWIAPAPIVDNKFCALGTNVDHDCVIYLHSLKHNSETLAYIEVALQNKFSNSKPKPCDMVWAPNDICIAQYQLDKKWYRAQVLKVLDNDEIQVIFVDYGNIDECKLGTLRKRVIMGHIPIQATKCIVKGLIPDNTSGKWTTSELDVIHALVVDKQSDVAVLQRNKEHLVVSITLRAYNGVNLLAYLRNTLRFKIHNFESEMQNQEEICDNNSEFDSVDTADVVIEEYVDNYMPNASVIPTIYNLGLNLESTSPERIENQICEEINAGAMDISDNKISIIDLDNETTNSTNSDCQMLSDDAEQMLSCSTPTFTKAINVSSTPVNEEIDVFMPRYKCIDVPDEVQVINLEPVHVDSPTVFFAKLDDSSQVQPLHAYEEQFRLMTKYMQLEEYNPPKLSNIRLYSPCSARFTADDLWYRAMITEILPDSNEVKVQYIDYGNSEYQPIDKIHSLADKWLALPMMSLKCVLWNVRVNPDKPSWRTQIDKFSGVFYRGAVTAKIKDRGSGTLNVELYSDKKCSKLLYDSLLKDGLLEIAEE